MRNSEDKIKKVFEKVHLLDDEKRDLFRRVNSVIDQIEAVSITHHGEPVLSPFAKFVSVKSPVLYKNLFQYIRQRKFVPSLVVMILLFATGGVSTAAEKSLPGDSLYSIKININEQSKILTAVTREAKAKVAVENTERRLQEAVALSAQGRLTEQNKQILEKGIAKSATEVKNQVASLVSTNNISSAQDIAVNFESSLKTHELILETLSVATETTSATSTEATTTPEILKVKETTNIGSIIDSVKTQIASTTATIADISNKDAQNADESKINTRIKEIVERYNDVFESTQNLVLSPKATLMINNYMQSASTSINFAKEQLINKDFVKCTLQLQNAAKALSDAESLIYIEGKTAHVEVKNAISDIDVTKLDITELDKISTSTPSN